MIVEPVNGTVAIDRHGNAWQQNGGWDMVGSEEDYCCTFAELEVEHGPVQLVWSPITWTDAAQVAGHAWNDLRPSPEG